MLDESVLRRLVGGAAVRPPTAWLAVVAEALWISSLTDPGQPARYVMDLVDLGRLGQRVCLAAAELGIGVFLTPAVHDRGVCSLLGLADAERRLTYVFGLGIRAT